MRTRLLQLPGLLLAVVLLATCTEQPTMAPDDNVDVVTTTLSSAVSCDLVRQMTSDVRDYFQMPERRDAAAEMRALGDACSAGTPTLMTSLSIGLLERIETAAQTNRGLSKVIGARLTQALLACTTTAGCSGFNVANYDLPSLVNLESALGTAGMFAVRTGDSKVAAVARGKVDFVDDKQSNKALFGTESRVAWTTANNGSAFVLLYGYPISPLFVTKGAKYANLGYSFNRWPDYEPVYGTFSRPADPQASDYVSVGACFDHDVGFPHPAEKPDPLGRMQRQGTILSLTTPTFPGCPQPPLPSPMEASIFAPAGAFALSLLPRSWSSMFMGDGIRTPVIGGGSIDYSNFAPVGASTAGNLVLTVGPKATYTVNEPLMIRVLAQSGDSVPMERVPVELYVAGNSGTPAGAVVTDLDQSSDGDGRWGYTSETDGTFLFNMAGLGKPGGYTLCARVRTPPGFEGFTFTEACTVGVFHVMQ